MRRDSLKEGEREQGMKNVISVPGQVVLSRVHRLPLPMPLVSGVRCRDTWAPNKKTPQLEFTKEVN